MEEKNPKEIHKDITLIEAQALIAQGNVIILDIRTPEEYHQQHLPHALHIDFYNPDFTNRINRLDKQKTYVVHCRSGGRSTKATQLMQQLGFQFVYNVKDYMFGEN